MPAIFQQNENVKKKNEKLLEEWYIMLVKRKTALALHQFWLSIFRVYYAVRLFSICTLNDDSVKLIVVTFNLASNQTIRTGDNNKSFPLPVLQLRWPHH